RLLHELFQGLLRGHARDLLLHAVVGAAARRGNRACLETPEVMRGTGMGMDGDSGVGNSGDGDIPGGRCEYRRWSEDLQGCTVARLGNDGGSVARFGIDGGIPGEKSGEGFFV